jgi:hypothetical protein
MKNSAAYVERVWFSSANPSVPGATTTPPCASNGYGPKMPLAQSTISAVRSTLARAGLARSPRPVEYALITGCPFGAVSWTISYWPMARNGM